MEHQVDWTQFKPPWDKLGPDMQLTVREIVQRIVREPARGLPLRHPPLPKEKPWR